MKKRSEKKKKGFFYKKEESAVKIKKESYPFKEINNPCIKF